MATRRLQNYLRRCRRRAGLSQDEVAFLLGCRSGAKISRYEHFTRLPSLLTALACEVIFRTPVRELFAGLFEQAERKVLRRARALAEKICASKSERLTNRKLEALAAAARGQGLFLAEDQ